MYVAGDYTGQKYGLLSPIEIAEVRGPLYFWKCKCDCGNETIVQVGSFRSGRVKSCGCLRKKKGKSHWMTKHGLSHIKEFRIWWGILRRCHEVRCKEYKHYGGRGITVCDRWKQSYENFLEDMGKCPAGLSIERIDNDGPYCKENCRWADRNTQCRNRRNNVKHEFLGEKRTIPEIAEILGLSEKTLYTRWYRNGKLELKNGQISR